MKPFRRNRLKRNIVRLARALAAHADGSRIYGYNLSRAARVRSGAMYPFLQTLLDHGKLTDGWETDDEAEGRPSRRYYYLTPSGASALTGILADAQQDTRFDEHAGDILAALDQLRRF
jgi:DNA-binding PadR family transcriptional regulator